MAAASEDDWLAVVWCLPDSPRAGVTRDPSSVLSAILRIVPSSSALWTATVAV
jgi:hypothetical protein